MSNTSGWILRPGRGKPSAPCYMSPSLLQSLDGEYFNVFIKMFKGTQHSVIQVNIFQAEKTIEIQLVRSTEVCSKILSEKDG